MLKSTNKTIFEALGRHPIHPFPARMAPGIALDALGKNGESLRVLDPMSGSGTVLAVARANGHRAFGVDLDPLSVLLADVWTRTVDAKEVNDKAAEVLSRARKVFNALTSRLAYPANSDVGTRDFIRYWFDQYACRQLTALSSAIGRVRDSVVRDVLWCAFSRLIIAKQAGASLAMDLPHSRPHRSFARAPIKPFSRFLSAVEVVVSNCPQMGSRSLGPVAKVTVGDARKLDVESSSIDLVLTSPPYLNAIDYMRCSKFSLVWMGYTISELRKIRASSVGTEAASAAAMDALWVQKIVKQLRLKPSLSARHHALLSTYAWDMGRALEQVERVLRPGGRAVYVVGESTCRGTFIRNSELVIAAADLHGLGLLSRQSRALPANRRYLPPPGRGVSDTMLNGRMRREVVVEFVKA